MTGEGAAPLPPRTPDRLDRLPDDALLARLFPPRPTEVEWGLARVRSALRDLGDPHERYPVIHVGGTNGKGSVAALVHAVLCRAGRRAVLYTSPHLRTLTERYRVGERDVPEATLLECAGSVRDAVVEHGLTSFEALTVLGFHLFAREGAEVAVVEVGLGGRLDATNVVSPVCTAITNVALDHAEFLGTDLEGVAHEKAGIVKAGVPVLTSEHDPLVLSVLREVAGARGAPLTVVDPTRSVWELGLSGGRTDFRLRTGAWGPLHLRTPLLGRHQSVNAALAVEILGQLPPALRPGRDAVIEGMERVRWPGRGQIVVESGTTWLLDVAHNPAGVAALAALLDDPAAERLLPRPRVAVVGILADKDWRGMLPPLLARCSSIVLTQPPRVPEGRGWDAAAVARAAEGEGWSGTSAGDLVVREVFGEAVAVAGDRANGGTVLVTGSFRTVAGALDHLDRGDPPLLFGSQHPADGYL